MSIREISSGSDTELTNDGQKLHQVWELGVLDDVLVLERYGSFCGWTELKLKRKGLEVYRIVKPWGSEKRTEYFFNQLTRVYIGDRLSFVEYITQIAELEKFPAAENFVQAGLKPDTERQYRDALRKILNIEVPPTN